MKKKANDEEVNPFAEKLGPLHYHEALYMADTLNMILEDHLISHPVIQSHPALKSELDMAEALISSVYKQLVTMKGFLFDSVVPVQPSVPKQQP